MADGSKIALFDAPGDLPVKLAFRTGIKHVAAKDARPEKRVVLMNAVEATEAPESRRVSDADLFFFFFLHFDFARYHGPDPQSPGADSAHSTAWVVLTTTHHMSLERFPPRSTH